MSSWLAERQGCTVGSHWRIHAHRSHLCLLLSLHLRLSLGHLLAKSSLGRNYISDSVIHLIPELVYNEGCASKEGDVEDVALCWLHDT